jgi:hypothetical protein
MSTVADIRIDEREVSIILNNIIIQNIRATKLIIFRRSGSDFKQQNELQKIDPRQINFQDSFRNTPLYVCVRLGFVKTAALLLFLGADVYLRNARGVSPIYFLDTHKTSLSRNQKSIQLLLQKSATLTTITSALSCRVGNRSGLKLLPIELIRLLDVMLFEPVTENDDEYQYDEDYWRQEYGNDEQGNDSDRKYFLKVLY